MCITETWLLPITTNSSINIPGYTLFRQDTLSSTPKHGVCIYLRETIQASPPLKTNHPNSLALHLHHYNVFILLIYRPPSNSAEEDDLLINHIANFSIGKELILLGDFNLPSLKWHLADPSDGSSRRDLKFLNLFHLLGMTQWITEPTFLPSGNTLDLVLTTEPDRLVDLESLPPLPHCGHIILQFNYLFQSWPSPDSTTSPMRCLNWARGDYHSIRRSLQQIDWDFEFTLRDAASLNAYITETLQYLSTLHIPPKLPTKRNTLPWLRNMPKHLSKLRSESWNLYKTTRSTYGRHSPQAKLCLYNFNEISHRVLATVCSLQSNYEQELLAMKKNKPKLFHSYIRNKKVCRSRIGPLRINGKLSDSPKEMAETFVESFSRVFETSPANNPAPHQIGPSQLSSVTITEADVEKVLLSLKPDSAMGPDQIHPRLLKECASTLAKPLAHLFNTSLITASVPPLWKMSHVSPIFKKGTKSDPLNYRPISLTSVICKSMERLITKALYSFLDTHSLLANEQFGFRANHSVTDQLLITYNFISHQYDQGNTVDLVLFDFQKAFDKVHHPTLLTKLQLIGISGGLLGWIKSFLCGRSMKVCVSGEASSSRAVLSGVPQGSVLGPLLFLIFINHIGARLSSRFMIFADDLKLFVSLPTPSSPSDQPSPILQEDINILHDTASSWSLRFAPDKCVHLRFSRRPSAPLIPLYHLNNSPIQQLTQQKDLGVMVSTNLRFHQHIRETAHKAGGVSHNLLKSTVNRSPSFMTALYTSDIRPIIDFASPLWNLGYIADTKLLEAVQRRWTKQVSGLSDSPYAARLCSLDLHSVKGRLLRYDLISCYKIFHHLSPITPSELFTMAPNHGTRGHSLKIMVQHCNTEVRKRFFSHRVVKPWNSLSESTVTAPSLNAFKARLQEELGPALFEFHQ